jgi:hypothetical protein
MYSQNTFPRHPRKSRPPAPLRVYGKLHLSKPKPGGQIPHVCPKHPFQTPTKIKASSTSLSVREIALDQTKARRADSVCTPETPIPEPPKIKASSTSLSVREIALKKTEAWRADSACIQEIPIPDTHENQGFQHLPECTGNCTSKRAIPICVRAQICSQYIFSVQPQIKTEFQVLKSTAINSGRLLSESNEWYRGFARNRRRVGCV